MPRLILSMDGLVLKEMVLEKERTTIGRKPHNDIQIDNLAISGGLFCSFDSASMSPLVKGSGILPTEQNDRTYL